ncbi:A-kinase anchor protein 10, mitochondrial [Rhagoletis pomonella]|uniref:A-kinase anchor protein 10, mitochondrial n=1 Tax=Rhagoletis pomonella TaxID=28610 RepID=UPI0017821D5C|nr:A-kinase anchor protein 10, mitochondrial [Rhagoletis pomonella]
MLKYFKKRKDSRSRGTWTDASIRKSSIEANEDALTDIESLQGEHGIKRNSLQSTSSFCDEILSQADIEDDALDGCGSCGRSLSGYSLASDEDVFRYKSRLAMTLTSILNDPNCLSYFVQYLDIKNALAPLKFYLDTDNFKTAALAHLEKREQNDGLVLLESVVDLQSFREAKNQPNNEISLTCEDVSSATTLEDDRDRVPELKSYYDLSMRQPLTDDEKSQIYEETNKQINESTRSNNLNKKCQNCSDVKCYGLKCSDFAIKTASHLGNSRECDEKFVSPASVKDAIAIYQKYLIAGASQFVSLPVSILSQISLLLCQRTEKMHLAAAQNTTESEYAPTIPATCFVEAQRYLMDQMERMYLNDFLQSPFYSKYCVELVENGHPQLSIYDILYSEATLFFFMEFLEQHGERECLDFWTSAINFRKSYEVLAEDALEKHTSNARSSVKREAQSDAMIIYEKFFSLQSETRLWLSDRLRSRVEECICADGRIRYCFDLPLQLIAKYLERKYFQDFLESQLFQNYLNELKLKIYEINGISVSTATSTITSGVFRKSLHRKTLSDCSEGNRREILKQNTLLAMDGNKLPQTRIKSLQQTRGSDLHIDSRQLTNPNLLWRRSYSSEGGALKFGHINELGRYERDFETVDSVASETSYGGKLNWSLNLSGNKIKNAMRKLVNLPEDKVQEEIAWQVAEMIVKDVTSVTLKSDRINSTTIKKTT